MLRRLIARLIGWRVVYLVDFDGEITQRLAQPDGIGGWYAWRMSRTFNLRRVSLLPGGEIKPNCYVQRWGRLAGVILTPMRREATMQASELRELSESIRVGALSQRQRNDAADYLRACADALDVGPVAWAATDETGKIVEALGMNRTRRFSDPLYLRPLPAQAQALRLPEPMTDEAIYDNDAIMAANSLAGLLFGDFATVVRAIEAEVLRRVKEANE